jgi:hypothetical protein
MWNSTSRTIGDTTTTSGFDSDGNMFNCRTNHRTGKTTCY